MALRNEEFVNILNAEKISKTFGEKELFNQVTLGVNDGDKIGVIGVNGTGKSTFLKIIAGIEAPDEGQIVKGRSVTVEYLPQTPEFLENDTIISYVIRGKKNSSEAQAKTILNKLGISDLKLILIHCQVVRKKELHLQEYL